MYIVFRMVLVVVVYLIYAHQLFAQSTPARDSLLKYIGNGNLHKAYGFAVIRSEEIKWSKGAQSAEYGSSLNTCGDILYRQGKHKEAEPFLKNGLEILQAHAAYEGDRLAHAYNTHGLYYIASSDFNKAEFNFKRAIDIRQKANKVDSQALATLYDNIGHVYTLKGDYYFAHEYLNNGLKIRSLHLGSNHPAVATSYNNLGNFFKHINDLHKAAACYDSAMKIFLKSRPQESPVYALYTNNLGSVKRYMQQYDAALELNLKALHIRQELNATGSRELAINLNSLGCLYFDLGAYRRAEKYFSDAMKLIQPLLPPNHLEVIELEYNMAYLWLQTARYQKADSMFAVVEQKRKVALGATHVSVNDIYARRAALHYATANWEPMETMLNNLSSNHITQIYKYFPFFTEAEKENFARKLNDDKTLLQALLLERSATNKGLAGDLYNHQLATKAVLLSSNRKLKQQINQLRDSSLTAKLQEWELLRTRVANARLSSSNDAAEDILALEKQAESVEKQLINATIGFEKRATERIYTWKDIQKKLKKHQVAIEIVRIPFIVKGIGIKDTSHPEHKIYFNYNFTDSIAYAVLLLRKNAKHPEVHIIRNGRQLEDKWLEAYRIHINYKAEDDSSYIKFWQPIQKQLGVKTKEVFISPDGVYNLINLNTLKNMESGKYLIEELKIHLITNSRDLLEHKIPFGKNKTAVLFGSPNYNLPFESIRSRDKGNQVRTPQWHSANFRKVDLLIDLEGTREEVEGISGVLKRKKWEVKAWLGDVSTEEQVKAVNQPGILHFATHGYFDAGTVAGGNLLLQSGLLLAGANTTLRGIKPDAFSDDGILTAYESVNLNLDSTDLVVLSACETGLGEIRSGEGVYGLQRGFKVAGARFIIMSLWKVDDAITQKLMLVFYKNLLSSSMPDVIVGFRKAQQEIKLMHSNPYFWGAFVLVGN